MVRAHRDESRLVPKRSRLSFLACLVALMDSRALSPTDVESVAQSLSAKEPYSLRTKPRPLLLNQCTRPNECPFRAQRQAGALAVFVGLTCSRLSWLGTTLRRCSPHRSCVIGGMMVLLQTLPLRRDAELRLDRRPYGRCDRASSTLLAWRPRCSTEGGDTFQVHRGLSEKILPVLSTG